jgi:hypothetical protein
MEGTAARAAAVAVGWKGSGRQGSVRCKLSKGLPGPAALSGPIASAARRPTLAAGRQSQRWASGRRRAALCCSWWRSSRTCSTGARESFRAAWPEVVRSGQRNQGPAALGRSLVVHAAGVAAACVERRPVGGVAQEVVVPSKWCIKTPALVSTDAHALQGPHCNRDSTHWSNLLAKAQL